MSNESKDRKMGIDGDALIMTDQGARQMRTLVGERFNAVVNGAVYPSSAWGAFVAGEGILSEVRTLSGYTLNAIHGQKVLCERSWSRSMVEVSDLKEGDRIIMNNHTGFEWTGSGSSHAAHLSALRPRLSPDGKTRTFLKCNVEEKPALQGMLLRLGVLSTAVHRGIRISQGSDIQLRKLLNMEHATGWGRPVEYHFEVIVESNKVIDSREIFACSVPGKEMLDCDGFCIQTRP